MAGIPALILPRTQIACHLTAIAVLLFLQHAGMLGKLHLVVLIPAHFMQLSGVLFGRREP